MTLLTLLDAELAFGLQPLLDRAALTVLEGDRVGLIGRNGTGKSSLLNVVAGRLDLDDGEVKRRDGLRVALVEQEPVLPAASTLRASLAGRGALDELHDERERWRIEARLVEFLHRFGLDEAQDPTRLSGGERKRGALALALALAPDLLLLDEPTNHLDIDGITLLEDLLSISGATSIKIYGVHSTLFNENFCILPKVKASFVNFNAIDNRCENGAIRHHADSCTRGLQSDE